MKRFLPALALIAVAALPAASVSAFDWGLVLNQTAEAGAAGDIGGFKDIFSYTGTLAPWLSVPFGHPVNRPGRIYVSAGATLEYANGGLVFVPELYRTEFAYKFVWNGEIKLGRIFYADPLGLIAVGDFDGVRYSQELPGGNSLHAGVWYTGLLYKTTAYITMTAEDEDLYYSTLDYNNFAETYFAPRRLLFALDWENNEMAEWLRLKASIAGQFDLSGNASVYHSQYFAAKAVVQAGDFSFDAGGCFGLAQVSGVNSLENKFSLAAELAAAWMPPTAIADRLKLAGRFSNGAAGSLAAFAPVTTQAQGSILEARFSGISTLSLDYSARVSQGFSFNVSSSYFILSDLATYRGWPNKKDGYFLGSEFYGRLVWGPFSDLRLSLGGGAFLPALGNADPKAGVLWNVEINVALAVF